MSSEDEAKSDVFMPYAEAEAESTTKVPTESLATESQAEPGSVATESRDGNFPATL